ncbi:acyloxyacyl hydrolase [Roseococcus sp. DSY-14]|uniref:acyloxyacyl hydrolase n=1 Tax=Roseococcus sp. DSY-14 TaxID=3369650 RepID=UPI00387B0F2C
MRHAALLAACLLALPAAAEDLPAGLELRVGLMAHDPGFLDGKESGALVNAEVLLPSPFPVPAATPRWAWLLRPRPHLGGSLNTAGDTSHGYAGLTWTALLGRDALRPGDAIRLDLFGGGALNDGRHGTREPDRKALGGNLLFRMGGEVGWQFTRHWSVSAYVEHQSNAGLARRNQGLNSTGLRLGYAF